MTRHKYDRGPFDTGLGPAGMISFAALELRESSNSPGRLGSTCSVELYVAICSLLRFIRERGVVENRDFEQNKSRPQFDLGIGFGVKAEARVVRSDRQQKTLKV